MQIRHHLTGSHKKSATGHQRFALSIVSSNRHDGRLNASDKLRQTFLNIRRRLPARDARLRKGWGNYEEKARADKQQLGEDAFMHIKL
jgi:hypothetical protein